MEESRREHILLGLIMVIAAVVFVLLLSGCRTAAPEPCIPTVIEGPPREITVVMPEAKVSSPPVLESLAWTAEQIEGDVAGYITALWEDIQDLAAVWIADREELIRLNAARNSALAGGAIEPSDND